VLVLVIFGGILAGGVCAWWILKMQTRWMNPTRLAAAAIMCGFVIAFRPGYSVLGSLAMGSFLFASIHLTLGILGKMALARLSQSHGRLLESIGAMTASPPPVEKDADSTRHAFLAALPQPLRDEIAGTFVPAIIIDPGEIDEELPAEVSSFGGRPVMEPGLPRPHRDGRPMDFLARINLSEVADLLPAGSPRIGLLSFFYDPEQPWGSDPEDRGSGCILYSPHPADCHTVEMDRPSSPRQAIGFRREIVQSIPEELEERFYTHFRSLAPKEYARLEILQERALEPLSFANRLVSHPQPVQNAMDPELKTACHAYGLPAETPWMMVLQLDSVSEQEWCWGDAGCLYFWIPEDDWRAARFDRPWVVLQCT